MNKKILLLFSLFILSLRIIGDDGNPFGKNISKHDPNIPGNAWNFSKNIKNIYDIETLNGSCAFNRDLMNLEGNANTLKLTYTYNPSEEYKAEETIAQKSTSTTITTDTTIKGGFGGFSASERLSTLNNDTTNTLVMNYHLTDFATYYTLSVSPENNLITCLSDKANESLKSGKFTDYFGLGYIQEAKYGWKCEGDIQLTLKNNSQKSSYLSQMAIGYAGFGSLNQSFNRVCSSNAFSGSAVLNINKYGGNTAPDQYRAGKDEPDDKKDFDNLKDLFDAWQKRIDNEAREIKSIHNLVALNTTPVIYPATIYENNMDGTQRKEYEIYMGIFCKAVELYEFYKLFTQPLLELLPQKNKNNMVQYSDILAVSLQDFQGNIKDLLTAVGTQNKDSINEALDNMGKRCGDIKNSACSLEDQYNNIFLIQYKENNKTDIAILSRDLSSEDNSHFVLFCFPDNGDAGCTKVDKCWFRWYNFKDGKYFMAKNWYWKGPKSGNKLYKFLSGTYGEGARMFLSFSKETEANKNGPILDDPTFNCQATLQIASEESEANLSVNFGYLLRYKTGF